MRNKELGRLLRKVPDQAAFNSVTYSMNCLFATPLLAQMFAEVGKPENILRDIRTMQIGLQVDWLKKYIKRNSVTKRAATQRARERQKGSK